MTDSALTSVAETHISRVFFVGERAYKQKKAVALAFLDWTSEPARREACEREVRLNRRLAPDVYQGVATVLGPDGSPCDHLVVMRRLPEDRRLARLVREGADVSAALGAIASQLAGLHASAPSSQQDPRVAAQGTADAVLGRWRANTDELRAFAGASVPEAALGRITDLSERYVAGRRALFAARVAEGRVRDGHGDLLADDIFCLDDGPRIIDCLEFDDHLRYGDVVEDAAFLAMDLERLGAVGLGQRFLLYYRQASGDWFPESLAHFFVAYRAQVRAKVACLRAAQGLDCGGEDPADLLGLAERHLHAAQVPLVLVGGLPGSGKTTFSRALRSALGPQWAVVSSDDTRTGFACRDTEPPAYGQGRYSTGAIDATYGELLRQARAHLEGGEPVILDASWTSAARRERGAALARATSSDLIQLCCVAPPEVLTARIRQRAADGVDSSEATVAVMERMATDMDPWPSAWPVDTSQGVAGAAAETARAIIDRRRPCCP